ncbi:MAG TPA: DUF5752 family protein [Candidatus Aquilonibacter sp.]|nr:DUF5752 family protein [Candidatus Aquilonibacter sp.]
MNTPFQFATASYLIRIGNQEASNLLELEAGIKECSDGSIFYHTFQSLGRHHFLTEGFSNDFAQWVQSSRNRPALAEQLASLDVREYVSLPALREDLAMIVGDYCRRNPVDASQPGFEPFYFCEAIEEQVPLGFEARNLRQFRDGLRELPHAGMQFHFLTSRLRLHLRSNDFSQWLGEDLGLKDLARRVNQIDVYANTLDSARSRIIDMVDRELRR